MNCFSKPRGLIGFLLLLFVISLTACTQQVLATWPASPAEADFASLRQRLMTHDLGLERREQLYFLWGQEALGQAQQAKDPALAQQWRQQAIGAFERALDLAGQLQRPIRINLEMLYQQEESSDQQQNDQQQGDQQQNDQQQGDQQQNDQQQGDQQQGDQQQGDQQQGDQQQNDQQQGDQQQGDQGDDDSQEARDVSGLVRDLPGQAELQDAVNRELRRILEREQAKIGTPSNVERDW
jgi:hypothetical protein